MVDAEPIVVISTHEAAYCPNFTAYLGSEGGSLEDPEAPNCSVLYKPDEEFNLTAGAQTLEIADFLLKQEQLGAIDENAEMTKQEDYLANKTFDLELNSSE